MVIDSININKTNNHSSSSPEHKKTTTYDVGNPCPVLGQAQECGGINWLNQFQNSIIIKWNNSVLR